MAFERHNKRFYSQRPSWNRQATIDGRPAWMVVEERKRQRQENRND